MVNKQLNFLIEFLLLNAIDYECMLGTLIWWAQIYMDNFKPINFELYNSKLSWLCTIQSCGMMSWLDVVWYKSTNECKQLNPSVYIHNITIAYMRPIFSNREKIMHFLLVFFVAIANVNLIMLYSGFINSNIRSHQIINMRSIGLIALKIWLCLFNFLGYFG